MLSVEGNSTMTTSVTSPSAPVDQGSAGAEGFQLDVRTVETGPAAAA
jgi:hypothetical protein